mgnify:FL=1
MVKSSKGSTAKTPSKAKPKRAYSKGGSTVNAAGNYTQPGKRKQIFNRIKAAGKGGAPGQWSARKAQMVAKAYKAAGGGYKS